MAGFDLMAAAVWVGRQEQRRVLRVESPKLGARWFAPARKDGCARRVHDVDACFSEGDCAIGVVEIANAYQRMLEAGHDVAFPSRPRWEPRKV